MQNSIRQIRRAMRGVTFAMALKNVCGDPASALQSFNPEIRFFCLAAIAMVQKHPLLKAALLATGFDDFARVTAEFAVFVQGTQLGSNPSGWMRDS